MSSANSATPCAFNPRAERWAGIGEQTPERHWAAHRVAAGFEMLSERHVFVCEEIQLLTTGDAHMDATQLTEACRNQS